MVFVRWLLANPGARRRAAPARSRWPGRPQPVSGRAPLAVDPDQFRRVRRSAIDGAAPGGRRVAATDAAAHPWSLDRQ